MKNFIAALLLTTTVAYAEGDAAQGEKQYKKCAVCHTVEEGGKNGTGPNLYNIFGRGTGQADFKYSKGFTEWAIANPVWTDELMDVWLTDPKKMVKGTKMQYKEKDAEVRANLIAYLKSVGVQ